LGIQAHAVHWTEVALLVILRVENAITAAGYPSRIPAVGRCALWLDKPPI